MHRAYGTRYTTWWWLQRIEIGCDTINRAAGSTCMRLIAYFFGLLPPVKCSPTKRGVASTNLSTTDFNPLLDEMDEMTSKKQKEP